MSEKHDDIIHEVSKLLFLLLFDMQRTVMQDWQNLDITMAQMKVLMILRFKGSAAISKIAEVLGISHPTASHLVDRLVQSGLVERVEHATDRRSNLARLTASGETLAQRLWQGRMDHLNNRLAQLDQQDLDALRQGLRALHRVASSLPSEPSAECNPREDHPPD